ncbi:helix-turn-helix domain-containing protein [Cellulomonas composti]|uniref:HTH cro/C1-type domain-containing protein n=1 Tax=Cellulomonas composti TaxID=266130 RepID=A0A511JED6_9CELL|nr:helix-turn-helix transcriptional regulator [Cellulomonas composti]GEL96358.1 hypothetical protein CCO02nite_30160 [Cellulomonas composti]
MDTTATPPIDRLGDMGYAHRLTAVRKQRGLTQQTLADTIGVHVTEIRRDGAGTSQPASDVVRAIAIGLSDGTDSLVFNGDERGPVDGQLRLRLERLDDEEAAVINRVKSVPLRHDVRQHRTGRAG